MTLGRPRKDREDKITLVNKVEVKALSDKEQKDADLVQELKKKEEIAAVKAGPKLPMEHQLARCTDPKAKDLALVMFLQKYKSFNAGEQAGLRPHTALKLIKEGVCKMGVPEEES